MKIFVFGSSIVSSYWNGAATYYRGCYKYLARRGHTITFAEPDAYGRQQHRDDGDYSYVTSKIYEPETGLQAMLAQAREADVVIKHSGIGVDDSELEIRVLDMRRHGAVVFWDVDAPATLARLEADGTDPFRQCIPEYDAVLTYGGGEWCKRRYRALGARLYSSIYNGLDPDTHYPVALADEFRCDVAFVGNRLPDREARVADLFLRAAEQEPASSFLLGGEGWGDKRMPGNVRAIGHVPTADHNRVNCSAGMVMNINRASMAQAGFSPPTRVFEVAGAGACMLCDEWPGLEDCFEPGKEILVVRSAEDVIDALQTYDEEARHEIGRAFRQRALRDHTYDKRAAEVERALEACLSFRATTVDL